MRLRVVITILLMLILAIPSFAESPYLFGWHFHRDSANIDCGGGKPGWVVGLEYSTNFAPNVDSFRSIVDEGHTLIIRVDYDGENTFPSNPAEYWLYAARYAYWVDKLKDYCHIWLIGNEEGMNLECFRQVRRAVHAIQPEAIFCAGAPGDAGGTLRDLGDYVDGIVAHTYSADWIGEMDGAIPSGKTKLAYITEFQSAPPNMSPADLRSAYAGFNTWNQTHAHKLEAACKFVYYQFGSEYTSLQMQPMQDADFNEAATLNSYTNSYAQPYLVISNIAAAGTSDTAAQISWTTDVGATGQVEYWEDGEIDQHFSDFYDTDTTGHTATIGGLTAGHTYHYLIKSYRSGRPLTLSAVQTFIHEPPGSGTIAGRVRMHDGTPVHGAAVTRNPGGLSFTTDAEGRYIIRGCPQGAYSLTCASDLSSAVVRSNVAVAAGETRNVDIEVTPKVNYLQNPGFESGMAGWTSWGTTPGIQGGVPWFGGLVAHTGERFLGVAIADSGRPVGGVYQRVTGLPPGTYRFVIYNQIYHGNNPYSETRDRIGIDPTGGTNPGSLSIRWSSWDYNFRHWQCAWKQLVSPAVTVSGGACTVFVQYDDQSNDGWHVHGYDDLALTGPALVTQTAASPADAKRCEDGAPVLLSGVVATTDKGALGPGVLYVEDPDRTSGIRVDMTGLATAVAEGNTVSVMGVMASANGERCIDATVVTPGVGAALRPVGLVCGVVGGGDYVYEAGPPAIGQRGVAGGCGVNNVGMLVRIAGVVTSVGAGYVVVSDGSMSPGGVPMTVKVDTTRVTNAPSAGKHAAITGILTVEVSGADLLPVVAPRRNADVDTMP